MQTNLVILGNAAKACLITIIPQIIFAYYISNVTLVRINLRKGKLVWVVLEILFLFLLTVAITQFLSHNIVGKYVYGVTDVSVMYQVTQFLSFVIYTGFSSGVMVTVKYVKQQLKTFQREKELIREKLSAELKMLRNQVNPHFLFNTLNNVYALTRKKSDKAPEVVMKLSDLLSFTLYESAKDTIAFGKEIAFLEDYIELERIRYSDRLTITFNRSIDNLDQPIAPLLLLPLIENAFKHGASESRFDSYILIDIDLENGRLRFSVENNYEEDRQAPNSTGLGIQSTRRQLELLYKDQRLVCTRTNGIYKVSLFINLHTYGTV